MTLEEAIKILSELHDQCCQADSIFCTDTTGARCEAVDMAISALEKQIPKKVRITTSTKRCATCGRQLSGIGNIHPRRNYCQGCGQKICWEEE